MAILFCTKCWTGQVFHTGWPLKCPACDRVVRWATVSMLDRPKKPYALTPKDQSFLHALRIDPEAVEG